MRCKIVNDEPWNYDEKKGEKVWKDACQDEITSIMKNKTWDLVDLPSGAKAIGLMWVFKVKRNSDGSINKYKARLVAEGYIQRHGVDYEECSSSSNRDCSFHCGISCIEWLGSASPGCQDSFLTR